MSHQTDLIYLCLIPIHCTHVNNTKMHCMVVHFLWMYMYWSRVVRRGGVNTLHLGMVKSLKAILYRVFIRGENFGLSGELWFSGIFFKRFDIILYRCRIDIVKFWTESNESIQNRMLKIEIVIFTSRLIDISILTREKKSYN